MPVINRDLSQLLTSVSTILAQHDLRAYVVGGFVRDWLLDRETNDIDIAVCGDALRIAQEIAGIVSGRCVVLDEARGVARVITMGRQQNWHLDFAAVWNTIEADLARRDFTINAMAIELPNFISDSPYLIDSFSGESDLKKGLVRAVNRRIFKEDATRLLRAVRLAAELGFRIEPETERLIIRDGQLVRLVPGERLREELLRLLSLSDSHNVLRYLDNLDLLVEILPELTELKGEEQPKEHYWNVFDHSLETVATVEFLLHESEWIYGSRDLLAVTPWSDEISNHFDEEVSGGSDRKLMLKLGGLLHDIAKPRTKTVEETGKMRFLGHAKEGASMAAAILSRLRFSSREIKLVENLVYYHLRPAQIANVGLPTGRAIYRYFRDTGDAGIDVLVLALADYLATYGPKLNVQEWKQHNQLIEYILAEHRKQQVEVLPVRLINGHDLINIFNLAPGPLLGKLLSSALEAQAAGEVTTREEAIALVRKELSKGICDGCCSMPFQLSEKVNVSA